MPLTYPKTTGYQRPADWLNLPVVNSNSDKFVGLHAIFENANFCALQCSGNYTVDWGDGTVENFASNVIAYHEYNYATYDVANATLCSRGYKQAIVVVTPQSGQVLSKIDLKIKHNQSGLVDGYSTGWLDIIINGSQLTTLVISSLSVTTKMFLLEQVTLLNIGSVTYISYMFYGCYSLQNVLLFNTASVTYMGSMFYGCYSLQSVPLFNTASVTNMSYMFANCYALQNVPLFNTALVTNMGSMFAGCYALQNVPLFNTALVTNMSYMFSSCYSLQSVPLFNTALVTDMGYMFYNCCLSKALMSLIKVSISFANSKLSAERLNGIYNNLATVAGQTITVTGNYGVATDDTTIATAKGWTVIG